MLGMNIKSITTVCGTDCSMDTIDTSSTSDHGMITYYYTDVAGDKGISDAKTYYNYLKSEKHCIKIDDFDEKKGNYSAYFQLNEKQEARLKKVYDESFGGQKVDLQKSEYQQDEPLASEAK